MITVTFDRQLTFDTLPEFYNWLMSNKIKEELKIEGSEEAKNLYEFFKFYISTKKECEDTLNSINESFKNKYDNEMVTESIEELIRMNSDGKFLRACLIALGYKMYSSVKDSKYLHLAAAYETFQTSILIHDDIIDNASKRRGKITIPKSYEERFDKYSNKDNDFDMKKRHISDSLGICIGDLGFYLASKILIDNYYRDESFPKILDLYNKIVINTIKGEIIDVELPFKEQYFGNSVTSSNSVMEIYHLKTAWYSIIGPFSLGMALANASSTDISKVEHLLNNLGIAFQIKDDILGIFGSEKEMGKSCSSDISEYKQTLLYTYLVENDRTSLKEISKYYGREDLTEEEIIRVKEIFKNSKALEYATNVMDKMFEDSKKYLLELDFIGDEYKRILYGFITYLNLRTK